MKVAISKFTGIDNINVPEKLALGACTEAVNVVFNGDGQVVRRPGTRNLGVPGTLASYGTFDQGQLFYVASNLDIVHFDGTAGVVVGTADHASPCFWAEESPNKVFMAQFDSIQVWNGTIFGPLSTDAMGLETGTKPMSVPGEIVRVNWVAGRLCVASFSGGFTRLTFSVPGIYGRVSIAEDWIEIPHKVTGLESFGVNLVITCLDSVFLYSVASGELVKKLGYGTPVGRPIARTGPDSALIWTNRGVVSYPEFENKTKDHYLSAPGLGCGTAIVQYEGNEYLVVSNDGLGTNYDVRGTT